MIENWWDEVDGKILDCLRSGPMSPADIARRTGIVSRWLILAGLACALILLVGIGISPWVELLFPAWILALSLDILIAAPPPSEARP